MQKLLYLLLLLLSCHFNSFSQIGANILIDNISNPNEVSIAINAKNTAQLVAGANLKTTYRSADGGLTWTRKVMNSVSGIWGDPDILCDTAGNFYYFHLSAPNGGWGSSGFLDRIVCQKSSDGGITWPGDYHLGLSNTNEIQDKQWTVVDPTTNFIYATWTQFDRYENVPFGYQVTPSDSSIIFFSRSIDGGQTWSLPIRISGIAGDCIDSDNSTEGAVPSVGPNGEIYVSWSNGNTVYFDKSVDYGNTWLSADIAAAQHFGGWDIPVSGMNRTNGMTVSACDLSKGPHRGTIYINWCDTRNGTNNSDVWLTKSVDGGANWSPAKKVNDDTDTTQQFLNWMSLDPVTGYIYILFYDRRNHISNDSVDVYMAVSKDGGANFINYKVSETPFLANANVFLGDYVNIAAYQGSIHPIWTRADGVQTSIWTCTINESLSAVDYLDKPATLFYLKANPNPFTTDLHIQFELASTLNVQLKLFNSIGREMATLIGNETLEKGLHELYVNRSQLQLSNGLYLLELRTAAGTSYLKINCMN